MVNSLVNHQAAAGTNGCQLCKPVVSVCPGLALDVRPAGRRSPGYTAPRATFAAAAGSRLDLRWHPRTGRPARAGLGGRRGVDGHRTRRGPGVRQPRRGPGPPAGTAEPAAAGPAPASDGTGVDQPVRPGVRGGAEGYRLSLNVGYGSGEHLATMANLEAAWGRTEDARRHAEEAHALGQRHGSAYLVRSAVTRATALWRPAGHDYHRPPYPRRAP